MSDEQVKMMTEDQLRALCAKLVQAAPSGQQLTSDDAQIVIRSSDQKLRDILIQLPGLLSTILQITKALVPILQINRSNPFNPAQFIGEGWGIDPSEPEDQASLAIKTLDPTQFLFEHMIEKGEDVITGKEKMARLNARGDFIRADARIGQVLYEDWQENGKRSILEYLYRTQGVNWMDFPGTIFSHLGVLRHVLFLCRVNDEWYYIYGYLDLKWCVCNPSLVFHKSTC